MTDVHGSPAESSSHLAGSKLSDVIQALPIAVFLKDTDCRYLDCNQEFTELLGVTAAELRGKTSMDLWPPALAKRYHEADLELLAMGGRQEYEFQVKNRQGELRDVVFLKSLFHDEQGEVAGIIGSYVDITERRRAERRLEAETERAAELARQADAANRAKSDFLTNMSHELRTPMNAILGYAQMIADSCPKSCTFGQNDMQVFLETIQSNGSFLLETFDEILDLSRMDAGEFPIDLQQIEVCDALSEVDDLMRGRAIDAHLELVFHFETQVPARIETDGRRLKQILINMLDNAIKFSTQGEVRMTVSTLQFRGEAALQFDVQDQGSGIASERIEDLFSSFTQGDASTTRRHGGAGVGLSISRKLALMLGGDLSIVWTELGKGTCIRLITPVGDSDTRELVDGKQLARANRANQSGPSESKPLAGRRILYVEDGLDNQRLVQFMLKKFGAEIDLSDNGQEGSDTALRASREGRPYDLILMDMQMPVMDGYEATRRLRKEQYAGPVVAVTAHAMSGDREKCLDAGCDEYLSKPVKKKALLNCILDFVARSD
jgi:PAS domain S-box-containing protein